MNLTNARVALVFDWMTTRGGAEEVNIQLHKMFPEAPIFTSIYNKKNFPELEAATVHTSFLQKLPFAKTKHQYFLSWMPYAYESFNLDKFDVVISSSHACAKGIITKPETLHICYCHSPMRYAWDDWHKYIKEYKMNPIIKRIGKKRLHKIRMWDRLTAERVDHFIANSTTTQKRIKKYYSKESEVIFPPVAVKEHKIAKEPKNFFLAAGRLTPYKKFDLIIEAFNKLGLPLKIAGTGICQAQLKKKANSNIEFLGYVPDEQLKKLFGECQAFIFPQIEDFGLTAVEAMASGRPVIAFKKGGALDTITAKTGVFFEEQTSESLIKAIEEFQKDRKKFNPAEIREHAKNFDSKTFVKKIKNFIEAKSQ